MKSSERKISFIMVVVFEGAVGWRACDDAFVLVCLRCLSVCAVGVLPMLCLLFAVLA